MTGLMTLLLNVGNSALHHDRVGVAVHSVAPLLLIVTAEAARAYRRAIANALDSIAEATEQAAEHDRRQKEAERDRVRQERDQEQARQEAKEQQTREQAERKERELREAEDRRVREEREYERQVAQDEADRKERQAQQERDHLLRLEQERTARDAAARQAEQAREERERRDAARAAAEKAQARQPVTVAAESAPRARRTMVVGDVSVHEFPILGDDANEAALYAIYKQARDESEYDNWADDPRFKQGGDLNGSQLGIRLGRTPAAGRTNVKPKFERWYTEELERRQQEAGAEKVLVSA
jgi:hypothetical protein